MDLRSNDIVSSLGHDWVNIVNIRLWLSLIDSISQKTQPWPIYFFQWWVPSDHTTGRCLITLLAPSDHTTGAVWSHYWRRLITLLAPSDHTTGRRPITPLGVVQSHCLAWSSHCRDRPITLLGVVQSRCWRRPIIPLGIVQSHCWACGSPINKVCTVCIYKWHLEIEFC